MSRSVSTHRHAVKTVYLTAQIGEEVEGDETDYWEFNEFIDDVRNVLVERYPSLRECDRWQDREDHVIAENGAAEVSVSEYNGIIAICLAPREDDDHPECNRNWVTRIADHWVQHIIRRFKSMVLVSQGTFSNGEQCFQRLTEPESCITSKEGRLW
jgi:hypothetical protein